jgi:hypothetical protein
MTAGRALVIAASAAALVVVMTAARPALALCPNCLGQSPTLTPALRLVGLFLLVPAAVFFVVARLVRRLQRDTEGP